MGHEEIWLCAHCADVVRAETATCEWCRKRTDDCDHRQSCDSQDVYFICSDCHFNKNQWYD